MTKNILMQIFYNVRPIALGPKSNGTYIWNWSIRMLRIRLLIIRVHPMIYDHYIIFMSLIHYVFCMIALLFYCSVILDARRSSWSLLSQKVPKRPPFLITLSNISFLFWHITFKVPHQIPASFYSKWIVTSWIFAAQTGSS